MSENIFPCIKDNTFEMPENIFPCIKDNIFEMPENISNKGKVV